MFQKVRLPFAVLFCLMFWCRSASAFLLAEPPEAVKGVAQRWLVEVMDVSITSKNDSLLQLIDRVSLGGLLYRPSQSLSEITQHFQMASAGSKGQLLFGLDLINSDFSTFQKLGLNAVPSVLAATADTSLIYTMAAKDAGVLKTAGVDFVVLDPFRLSFLYGFGVHQQATIESAMVYLKAFKDGGIDIVASISSETGVEKRIGLAEEITLLRQAGVKAINLSSLKAQAAEIADEYEADKWLHKEHDYQPLTVAELPKGKLREQDLKRPMADMLTVSIPRAYTEIEQLANDKINDKKQKAAVGAISQWKLQRLLEHQIVVPTPVSESLADHKLFFDTNLKSATLLANANAIIPFRNLESHSFAASVFGAVGADFLAHMHKYVPVTEFEFGDNLERLEQPALKIAHFDNYVVAIDLHWFDKMASAEQWKLLEFLLLLQESKTEVTLVLLGSTQNLNLFAPIKHLSYHPAGGEQAERLAPQLLFGAYAYEGRWQGVSELFPNASATTSLARLKYGEPWMRTIKGLDRVDSIATQAILDKATPGCQVLVAKGGTVVYEKSFGYLSYDSLTPVNNQTLYDLASLTKVSATLQALMVLVDQGKIDIKSHLGAYLPSTHGTNKEKLIVEDVLLHQAGLKPYIPFWQRSYQSKKKKVLDPMFFNSVAGEEFSIEILPGMYSTPAMKDSVWQWTLKTDLMTLSPGDSGYTYKYSDLGFMIIQKLVEEVSGMPLDEFLSEELYRPLGMDRICFQPLCSYPYQSIAPTELDYYFRKNMVWGTVHDENAAIMGGVAGHAGLFGNANSLAILLQMHLQKGYYGGRQYVDSKVVDLFTHRLSNEAPRALGWDMKDLSFTRNNTSFWSSETTYGHTGFTGTAVWVDPEMELIYIFLSNRVHPNADNYKLVESNIRTSIQDVIYQSLGWQLTSGD